MPLPSEAVQSTRATTDLLRRYKETATSYKHHPPPSEAELDLMVRPRLSSSLCTGYDGLLDCSCWQTHCGCTSGLLENWISRSEKMHWQVTRMFLLQPVPIWRLKVDSAKDIMDAIGLSNLSLSQAQKDRLEEWTTVLSDASRRAETLALAFEDAGGRTGDFGMALIRLGRFQVCDC